MRRNICELKYFKSKMKKNPSIKNEIKRCNIQREVGG